MNLYEELAAHGEVTMHEPMRRHTSYQIGGVAEYFVRPNAMEDIPAVIDILHRNDMPFLILGKGSNVLISDEPYPGAVISLEKACSDFSFDDNNVLTAGAGCSLIQLAYEAQQRSLGGLEFASGIPGTIGGGLYMNAGAYKSDMSQILIEVLVLKDGKMEWMGRDQLDYTYRHSSFQQNKDWIILEGRFQLVPGRMKDIRDLIANRKERRMSTQPLDKPCAGSVFRNPEGANAWKIVDDLGFRGRRCGGAQVSEKHSNFIVNENGTASASDVNTLILMIQQAARERFGVDLIPEVERVNWNGKG